VYKYFELTYSPTPLPALTLHTHVAHTGGGFDYVKEYMDFTAGASYKWKSLTFDISAVGTNISRSDVNAYNQPAFEGSVPASVNTYWYRPAMTGGVLSVTASF